MIYRKFRAGVVSVAVAASMMFTSMPAMASVLPPEEPVTENVETTESETTTTPEEPKEPTTENDSKPATDDKKTEDTSKDSDNKDSSSTDNKGNSSKDTDDASKDSDKKEEESNDDDSKDKNSKDKLDKDGNPVADGQLPEDVMLDENGEVIPPEAIAPTNEELVLQQNIVIPEPIKMDFRLIQIEKNYAFAVEDLNILEEKKDDARTVGTLKANGLCYIIKANGDWMYVESGQVRGFVKKESLRIGEEAEAIKAAVEEAFLIMGMKEPIYTKAEITVEPIYNKALLYSRESAETAVADKIYARCMVAEADILEGRILEPVPEEVADLMTAATVEADQTTEEAEDENILDIEEPRVVGTLKEGQICYVLADADKDWVFVESGDVRGFISKESISFGNEVQGFMEKLAEVKDLEKEYGLAKQLIAPEKNAVCYYSLLSVKEGLEMSVIRQDVVTFASQFIGNPYVWGGTDPLNGIDCSGFTMYVYGMFGISLPHSAAAQSLMGVQIPVENAEPGDLIFFATDGVVNHVAIYAGDGQTIEAANERIGIVRRNIPPGAVWATRLL